jgi:hypothetical protein
VNFKKNEKIYNAANSEVLKMVQEIDSEPKEPEPGKEEQAFVIILRNISQKTFRIMNNISHYGFTLLSSYSSLLLG